jgi:hypothetical protein
MIEYFRLNIEDLRFTFGLRPVGVRQTYAPAGVSIKKNL